MESSRYYIYGQDPPTICHTTFQDAEVEAMRLAKKHPGVEFYILRAVRSIRFEPSPFIKTNYSKKG